MRPSSMPNGAAVTLTVTRSGAAPTATNSARSYSLALLFTLFLWCARSQIQQNEMHRRVGIGHEPSTSILTRENLSRIWVRRHGAGACRVRTVVGLALDGASSEPTHLSRIRGRRSGSGWSQPWVVVIDL
jgi:hypothetical protein